ncbi:FXYD domain-containing ion transport regulator 3-like isoform X2 [Syngnathoides biaculeatus]|uniref:FXYD domain-containing ion transport regulator 3-like isoform X2 n=1 Tax=Syngnathoides biaculeatus TaxID=300417 RepID=UPI002ADD3818|nr:FXYD domain-containing ion transport regulator 3-like isoform X2 [Syngnathoides biaculeatus]
MSTSLKMSKICALVFMTCISMVFAEEQNHYHRLRVGGLILAAVLCLIGITILFSGHCRCKFKQDKRRRTGSNTQAMLNDQGRACDC